MTTETLAPTAEQVSAALRGASAQLDKGTELPQALALAVLSVPIDYPPHLLWAEACAVLAERLGDSFPEWGENAVTALRQLTAPE